MLEDGKKDGVGEGSPADGGAHEEPQWHNCLEQKKVINWCEESLFLCCKLFLITHASHSQEVDFCPPLLLRMK